MANYVEIDITGHLPIDCARGSMIDWLAIMNTPSYGFKIKYGSSFMGPKDKHGDRVTYYNFHICGVEATWQSTVQRLIDAIIEVGGMVTQATGYYIENNNVEMYLKY